MAGEIAAQVGQSRVDAAFQIRLKVIGRSQFPNLGASAVANKKYHCLQKTVAIALLRKVYNLLNLYSA